MAVFWCKYKTMRLKVRVEVEDEKIKCICLATNKRCKKKKCETGHVEYDQFDGLRELARNKERLRL